MAEKIIRSHGARVKAAKRMIDNDPYFKQERITIIDREAFVEFLLLEDIVRLYNLRIQRERSHVASGRADEKGKQANITKFSAIIDVFEAAIGAARASITSGDYKRVWKAIPEGALMAAAGSVKNLPKLRDLAVELLRELSKDMLEAVAVDSGLESDLDELDDHEENVRRVRNLPPTMDRIEEVIRAVEAAIPDVMDDRKRNSKLDANT